MLRVVAISGSLREESLSSALIEAIATLTRNQADIEMYDSLASLPPFSPDLDMEPAPAPVAHFRAFLQSADAVLICTPEYAYGMPGALKNALDWVVSSGELYRKPVAALSAGPSLGGGCRALAWLTQVLAALDATVPAPATFPVPAVREKVKNGRVLDEDLARQIRSAVRALVDSAA